MLATALALIAYSASANSVAALTWQTDYAKAYANAVQQHKPLAVFIGTGTAGPAAVVSEGVSDASTKLLASSYVVVYIDSNSEQGKTLAATFEMDKGFIISDKTGAKQALRLTGSVTASDLSESLVKFADTTSPATTVTTLHPAPVYLPQSPCASGRCPNAR